MAAIAYPMGGSGRPRRHQSGPGATPRRPDAPYLRLVGADGHPGVVGAPADRARRPVTGRPAVPAAGARRLARWLSGVATLVVLGALWLGAGALSSARPHGLAVLPGARRVANGYVYVVRPGDTLWAIATRIDPNGDPRALVSELSAELHGATLQPGEQLRLP
ncbi:MAG TPA: LysM peptidoglycan-binding domain-containing protein [Acidimicrobiales bacterium]|nr:LysM peptidoglycan-binding domain-containing protein [Acidimicrobiales bacterium]